MKNMRGFEATSARRIAADLSSTNRIVMGSAVISALAFVWSYRFLPMQDWPDWIVQGTLFADALRNEVAAPYSIKHGPVPNVISSICIGLLSLLLHPETAGKLVLSSYVVGSAFAAYYLLRDTRAIVPFGILVASLITLTSFPFFHGEINYALGLMVLYAGQGFLLRRTARHDVRALVGVLAFTTVIFFCHGACYALWVMFLVGFAWTARNWKINVGIAVAMLPSFVLTVLYTLSKTVEAGAVVQGGSPLEIVTGFPKKLWLVFKFLAPFQGFYPFLDLRLAWVLVAGNFVALGFVLFIVVRWIRTPSSSDDPGLRVIRNTLLLYGVAFVLAPQFIGGLLNPAERFVLPTFHLLLAALPSLRPQPDPASRLWHTRIGLIVLALQAAYLHGYGGFVSRKLEVAYAQMHEYAVQPTSAVLHESHFRYEGKAKVPPRPLAWQLLPLHFPMLRLTYYANREVGRALPIFETGQFRSTAYRVPNSAKAVAAITDGGPIIIVGRPAGNKTVARLLPKHFEVLRSDDSSFVVMGDRF